MIFGAWLCEKSLISTKKSDLCSSPCASHYFGHGESLESLLSWKLFIFNPTLKALNQDSFDGLINAKESFVFGSLRGTQFQSL